MTLESRITAALSAHPGDKKLRLLASGFQDAWKACVAERTAANLKALETWETKLGAYLDALPAPSSPAPWPDILENETQVHSYLVAQGWAVARKSVYNHVKTCKLSKRQGGGFDRKVVDAYARAVLKRGIADATPTDSKPAIPQEDAPSSAQEAKALNQARLIAAQADKAELTLAKEKALLVPAADMAITLASFGAVVESELKNSLRQQSPKMIAAVNGDQGRVAQLRRMLLDAVDAGLRHAASVDEYKVHFEALGGE